MSKNEYRVMFNSLKEYIKIGKFADNVGIARNTLSLFLRGSAYNYAISEERLRLLYNNILMYFRDIT